jgi:glycosyltransferase involved in cell wall biosynthesis
MKYPKILVTTYSTAFLSVGGGEYEIVDFIALMKSLDFDIDLYGVDSNKIDFYNCAFHYSVHPHGEDIFIELMKHKIRVFLWPNIWFSMEPNDSEKERILFFANKAKILLFKSYTELSNFCQYFPDCYEKSIVVPIALPERYLNHIAMNDAKLIAKFDEYIISIGRIEPIKNQRALIKACNELNLNCIFVGGFSNHDYFNECADIAGHNIQFLPPIKPQSELLISLITLSNGSAEISFDPPGRSAIEVAALKRPLLQSNVMWAKEYFSDFSIVCSPNDIQSVCEGLERLFLDQNNQVEEAFRLIEQNNILGHKDNKFLSIISKLFSDV